jgi:aspartyl-tRNA synthetase
VEADGSVKSSADKFYSQDDLVNLAMITGSEPGDLILMMGGPREKTLTALGELRLEIGRDVLAFATALYTPLCGWSISRCWSGTTRHNAFTPSTIPLRRPA